MTNFEKWRDSLTAEWVAAFMERYSIHCGCYECPAEWYHKHGKAKGRSGCREVFLEWANAPAEEKKEPPLLIYEEKGEKVPCPVCGAPAAPIKNKPGVFLCKRCEGLVCAKEEGK